MALTNALLLAKVMHARHRPKKNAFIYKVYYLCAALRDFAALGRLKLFSLNRFNLFSFYDADHGPKNATPEAWVRGLLREWDVPQADGAIVVLTLPRLLGHVFNPVSFWFCLDAAGALRAVVSEVNNTFGDTHSYISFHDDRRVIASDDWLEAEKVFHVSPFLAIAGKYRFRFAYGEKHLGVWINHFDAEGLLLETAVTGKRVALNDGSLLRAFLSIPLVTLKVVALIYFQALRLALKGIRYRERPKPPDNLVSR